MTALRSLWAELWRPSRPDEPPYLWLLIAIGHVALGAAVATALMLPRPDAPAPLALPAGVALAYWHIKERADLRRGGLRLDSLVDAAFVGLGAAQGLIPGHALVAPAVALLGMTMRGEPPIRAPP